MNREGVATATIRALVQNAYTETGLHMLPLPAKHSEELREMGMEGGARDLVALRERRARELVRRVRRLVVVRTFVDEQADFHCLAFPERFALRPGI